MSEPVAIVGMSVLLPGAPDLATYWRNLAEGVDAITEVPPEPLGRRVLRSRTQRRADRVYCRRGGFVDELADVDVAGVRHHAELRAGHRARPADRAAGGGRGRSRTRAARTGCPPTGTGSASCSAAAVT